MRKLRFTRLWQGLGFVLVGIVLVSSLVPFPSDANLPDDKLMHLVAYLGLALWFGAIYRVEQFAWVGMSLVSLGLLIEILQSTTSYRSFELADLVADTLGTLAGLVLAATPLGGVLVMVEKILSCRD